MQKHVLCLLGYFDQQTCNMTIVESLLETLFSCQRKVNVSVKYYYIIDELKMNSISTCKEPIMSSQKYYVDIGLSIEEKGQVIQNILHSTELPIRLNKQSKIVDINSSDSSFRLDQMSRISLLAHDDGMYLVSETVSQTWDNTKSLYQCMYKNRFTCATRKQKII